MKKAALVLGIIFLVGALTVFWLLHRLGPSAPSQLVPKNTVAMMEAPDIASALEHWKGSELGKMSLEPEIQLFLQRPLDAFYQWSGLLAGHASPKTIADLLVKIKPGRFFAALEPAQNEAGWIIGCQFFGSKAAAEEALAQLAHTFEASLGASHDVILDQKEHHGELITQKSYSSLLLYTSLRGNWCFVSNNADVLQQSLDFSAGRSNKKESLAASLLYQKNRARLLPEADLLLYVKRTKALEAFPYLASLLHEQSLTRLAQTCGASFRFVEEGIQEVLFLNGDFSTKQTIAHDGLRFTQATTLGYIERTNNWEKIADHLQNNPTLPAAMAQFFTTPGLDFSALAALLKPEITLALDWKKSLPSLLIAAPEKDSEQVAAWLDQAAAPLGTSIRASDQSDLLMLPLSRISSQIEPTLASANGSFFIATDPSLLKQMSSRTAATPTLEASPLFSKNDALYHEANEAFFYFSTKELFEHGYELARPSLLFGNTLFPAAKAVIDFSKFPKTATIANHLTPIVIAQSHVDGGFLIQSRGLLSATPLFFIGKTIYKMALAKEKLPNAAGQPNATDNSEEPATPGSDGDSQ